MRDSDVPTWTPRSQREPPPEPAFGRRLSEALDEPDHPALGGRAPARGRSRARRAMAEADVGDRPVDRPMAGEAETAPGDGLSTLAKTAPARPRKGSNGSRRQAEGGVRRPTLPEGVEMPPEPRRRTRRPADGPMPPPVNWRELTAPPEGPPPPPVNWRELAASSPDPSRELTLVPQREPEAVSRRMGFLERLGFGRRRA
jgi:hypothetical protein